MKLTRFKGEDIKNSQILDLIDKEDTYNILLNVKTGVLNQNFIIKDYQNTTSSNNEELLYYIIYQFGLYENYRYLDESEKNELHRKLSIAELNLLTTSIQLTASNYHYDKTMVDNVSNIAKACYGEEFIRNIDKLCLNIFRLPEKNWFWKSLVKEANDIIGNIHSTRKLTPKESQYIRNIGNMYINILKTIKKMSEDDILKTYPFLFME